MRQTLPTLLFALLLAPPVALPAEEGQSVWGAVVFAVNDRKGAPLPAKLGPFEKTLRTYFGYDRYEIVGENMIPLDLQKGPWLIPSDELYLKVFLEKKEGPAHLLYLELYQGKKQILTSRARLGVGGPLFIRGPFWGQGQLIIMLMVK